MESTWTDAVHQDLLRVVAPTITGLQGVHVGTLITVAPGPEIVCEGLPSDEAVPARTTVPLAPGDEGRSVVLVFEGGDPERPIIIGLIHEQQVTVAPEKEVVTDARIDGKRVCLEAEKEIVLRCGKSSVTLRADGKIVIKGMEIVSRAKGTNKVKGGTVRIN